MKLLSGILAATLTSVVALASANAADMYAGGGYKDGPAYVGVNWSGLYVGVNGGYGWSQNTSPVDPTGAFGGGQIGYNFQRGNIVFGIETDFQGSGISDSAGSLNSSLDWFGSVRGRLGYAFERALVYGTGGFGYGQVTNEGLSQTQTGWVAGAGVEYKITPSWSAKAEYQYFDLGEHGGLNNTGPLDDAYSGRTQFSTFRVGVNYFVGGGYDPLK
jgi:outer membrane immunogenic protein